MSDEISVHPETVRRWGWMFVVPREKSSDPKFIKHVRCEGARFHVLSWDSNGTHCSEKDCIINKRALRKCRIRLRQRGITEIEAKLALKLFR